MVLHVVRVLCAMLYLMTVCASGPTTVWVMPLCSRADFEHLWHLQTAGAVDLSIHGILFF